MSEPQASENSNRSFSSSSGNFLMSTMRLRRDTGSFSHAPSATTSVRNNEYAAWLSEANMADDVGDDLQVCYIIQVSFVKTIFFFVDHS